MDISHSARWIFVVKPAPTEELERMKQTQLTSVVQSWRTLFKLVKVILGNQNRPDQEHFRLQQLQSNGQRHSAYYKFITRGIYSSCRTNYTAVLLQTIILTRGIFLLQKQNLQSFITRGISSSCRTNYTAVLLQTITLQEESLS